ncbi:MAG: permease prefix domain 1-containing protein [Yaniella sp.]|nr:permease prefix domain 1-containing protein [Yaniella sp.]
MTTPLPERYIAATVKYLSPELQAEVRPELHASIADAVEAQVAQGEDYETAERNVLTELGDPAVLAASYSDRTLQLIGPRYYLSWWCLLKRLLLIVPAAVLGVVAFAQLLAGGDLGDIIGGSIGAAVTAGLHVCFWVTLVFAILERSDADTGITWDVDQLPEPRQQDPGRLDLIASLVFLGLMILVVLWDQIPGFIRIGDQSIPILSPALWPWAMLGLLGIIGLEIGFAILLYVKRQWNAALAIINTVLSVLFFSWVISLLVRGELFSEMFLELAVDNAVSGDSLYTIAVIFGFSVGIICVWDIIDGWVKTYRVGASDAAEQQPAATQ